MKLPKDARFATRLHSRRTGTRSDDRRDHHAHLSDVDLRAGGARPAQGVRIRAHAESRRAARSKANLAAIEGGRAAFAFASGMSAISAITARLATGDHVVVTDNTYGGTFRLFDKVLTRYGFTFSYVDTSDLAADRARHHAGHEAGLHRDADQPGPAAHGHRRRRRRSPIGTGRSCASTTRSRARACSSRSRSAPTSSCTARPST